MELVCDGGVLYDSSGNRTNVINPGYFVEQASRSLDSFIGHLKLTRSKLIPGRNLCCCQISECEFYWFNMTKIFKNIDSSEI